MKINVTKAQLLSKIKILIKDLILEDTPQKDNSKTTEKEKVELY